MFHVKQSPADTLEQYAKLLQRYHGTLDLMSGTALADIDSLMADAKVYATVLAAPYPAPDTILDLGSGAGLPGIVIATLLPQSTIVLAERRRRRAAFLKLAVGQLGLDNATVFAGDVKDLTDPTVDAITAQAVGNLTHIYCVTRHLHASEVVVVARKGAAFAPEVELLRQRLEPTFLQVEATPLSAHGRLVALHLPGGLPCPSLASSTKKGGSERQPPQST